MSTGVPHGEVHVRIDRLVVTGLSQTESRAFVGELRAGLTEVLSGRANVPVVTTTPEGPRSIGTPNPALRSSSGSPGRDLARTTAASVARAAGWA